MLVSVFFPLYCQPIIDTGSFLDFHTILVLVLGKKADFWLVCDRYITNIETHIALIFNWYYLKSLEVSAWYCIRSYQSRWFFDIRTNTNLYTKVLAWYPPNAGWYTTHRNRVNEQPIYASSIGSQVWLHCGWTPTELTLHWVSPR